MLQHIAPTKYLKHTIYFLQIRM